MTEAALAALDDALNEWVAALVATGATQRHEDDPEAVAPLADALARLVGGRRVEGGVGRIFLSEPGDRAGASHARARTSFRPGGGSGIRMSVDRRIE